MLLVLWGAFTVVELTKYLHFALCPSEFDIRTGLPFHLCSVSLFTYPPAVFTRSETFRNFIYAVNMPGAFFALITPDVGQSPALSFYFIHLMAAHTLIVLVPLYMVVCGVFRPRPAALPKVTGLLVLTMLPALVLNRLIGSNYFFIGGSVPGTLTEILADSVGEDLYLLPMVALLLAVWLLLYLPFVKERKDPVETRT